MHIQTTRIQGNIMIITIYHYHYYSCKWYMIETLMQLTNMKHIKQS